MGCFSGCLMPSASDQKLFCEVWSAFKCSFDEFVGESGLPILFLRHLQDTTFYHFLSSEFLLIFVFWLGKSQIVFCT